MSLDIFDTLLLRCLAPEYYRFLHMAKQIRTAILQQHNLDRPTVEIFKARLLAAEMVYRTAPELDGEQEGKHDRIVALQLRALDLPESLAPLLLEIETNYETGAVSPDLRVVALALRAREFGKRVILVSDMYMGASTIANILDGHDLGQLADAIYVSSEIGLTKRHGGLFPYIIEHENRPASGYFHLGDNRHADLLSARRLGWVAAWRPRRLAWRVANYGLNNLYRLYAAVI